MMKYRYVIYYIVTPLSALFSTLFAMSIQPIIDYGLNMQLKQFIGAVVTAIVLCLLDILFGFYTEYYMKVNVTGYTRSLRIQCMDNILQCRYDRFVEKPETYYTSLLTVNTEQIGQKYFESGMKIYRYSFSLLISIIAIGYAGWEILLYVITFSLISVYLPKLLQTQSITAEKEYAELNKEHITFVQETFQNFIPIRVFRLWSQRCRKYREKCEEVASADCRRNRKTFLLNSVAAGIGEMSYIMIIIFAMILVIRGKLTVGYIMSVSQILGGIMFPFEILPGCILERKTGLILKKSLEKNCNSVDNERMPIQVLKHEPSFLECANMSIGYAGKEILHNMSFRFDISKKYAIIGKSGSGKSTLAKGICGFLEPIDGQCMIENIDVRDVSYEELYRYLIYQDQNAKLFDDTIFKNIDLKGVLQKEKLFQIAKKMRLEKIINKGTERQEIFSGGETQRILLARAFASDAKMVILDECLSALDNENAKNIESNILKQTEMGVIMITHRIYEENMYMYDGVLLMEDGRLAEYGTWDELRKNEKVMQLIAK